MRAPIKIAVENLNKTYRLDDKLMSRIAGCVLRYLEKTHGIELELVFLDDAVIRELNRRYKRRDRATDVLSFLLDGVGLIYISIDRAAAWADEHGLNICDELIRYVIHGILHLFGYDDTTRCERKAMSAKEDEILRWLATKENLSKVLTPR